MGGEGSCRVGACLYMVISCMTNFAVSICKNCACRTSSSSFTSASSSSSSTANGNCFNKLLIKTYLHY